MAESMHDDYTMADVRRNVAQNVAKPVLDYLRNQTNLSYFVKSSEYGCNSGSTDIFKVKTPGLYRGIFGKTICEITLDKTRGFDPKVELKSFSEALPQQTLEELMSGVDVYKIVLSGAVARRAAVDYQ